MKILIVDDDTLILEILTLYLGTIDYDDVHCAENGMAALSMIKATRTPFDCILLDISMPQLTGIALISHIRKHRGYESTPIIMMTALNDKSNITSAFVAGAFDYITKPFEFYELESQLQAAKLRGDELTFQDRNSVERDADVDELVRNFFEQVRPQEGQPVLESGLLSERGFENCLRRVRAQSALAPNMVTLHMRGYSALPVQGDADRPTHYLISLAETLAKLIRPLGGIATYLGDCTFIVVSFPSGSTENAGLSSAVQQAVMLTDQTYQQTNPGFGLSNAVQDTTVSDRDASYLIYALKQANGSRVSDR